MQISHTAVLHRTAVYEQDLVSPSPSLLFHTGPMRTIPHPTYAYDRSRYQNHGTITGAVYKQLPNGLWVLQFDGADDYVDCGNASSLNVTTGLTVAVWVKASNWAQNYTRILAKGAYSTADYEIATGGAGQARVICGIGLTQIVSSDVLLANHWHRIVFTANPMKVFIDGVLNVTGVNGTFTQGARYLVLGCTRSAVDVYINDFTGYISDVVIEARAWSAEEIKADYVRHMEMHR